MNGCCLVDRSNQSMSAARPAGGPRDDSIRGASLAALHCPGRWAANTTPAATSDTMNPRATAGHRVYSRRVSYDSFRRSGPAALPGTPAGRSIGVPARERGQRSRTSLRNVASRRHATLAARPPHRQRSFRHHAWRARDLSGRDLARRSRVSAAVSAPSRAPLGAVTTEASARRPRRQDPAPYRPPAPALVTR